MELEALVTEIVREVVARTAGGEGAGWGPNTGLSADTRSVIRVLGKKESPWVDRVAEFYGDRARLVFGQNGASDDTLVEDAQNVQYVLPRLSLGRMADLAQGRAGDDTGEELLRLLLSGKKIQVFSMEYRDHEATAPKALIQVYKDHEATLATFGITRLGQDDKAPAASFEAPAKKLVTEKDVMDAHGRGMTRLILGRDALITPLARETAQELNMGLVGREVSK